MTDKEKVIQLLLDNGFEYIATNLYESKDIGIYLKSNFDYKLFDVFNDTELYYIVSYRELVGFLYLKYGKVYISEK